MNDYNVTNVIEDSLKAVMRTKITLRNSQMELAKTGRIGFGTASPNQLDASDAVCQLGASKDYEKGEKVTD